MKKIKLLTKTLLVLVLLCVGTNAWGEDYVWNFSNDAYQTTYATITKNTTHSFNSYNGLGSSAAQSASPLVLNYYAGNNDKWDSQSKTISVNGSSTSFDTQLYLNGTTSNGRYLSIKGLSGSGYITVVTGTNSNNATIVLSKAASNSTSATNDVATIKTGTSANSSYKSGLISDLDANTTYYINCTVKSYLFAIIWTPAAVAPDAISFNPAAGSVAQGTSVTLTSTGATTIKYQWSSAEIGSGGDWSGAQTYSNNNKPVVPAVGSSNTVLSVKASNANGDTYGSASYTPVRMAYRTIYSFADGIGSQEVTSTATDAAIDETKMSIINNPGRIKLTPATGFKFKNGDAITFSGSIGNTSKKYGIKYGPTTDLGVENLYVAAGQPCSVSGTLTLASEASVIYISRNDGSTTNMTSFVVRRLVEATSETFTGVKIDGSAATVDEDYTVEGNTITLSGTFTTAPTVALVNHIVFADASTEDQDQAVSFGAPNGEFFTGTVTIDGTTYTVKAPCGNINTLKVQYKSGNTVIKEENLSVTGLKVGASYTVPFRMYVEKDGALYKTTANGSNPWYGDAVTLTENHVVTKSLSTVDLGGGTIELFEDFDGSTGNNANIRASNCSAYDNTGYTSTNDLPAGKYNFIIKAANINNRGSVIKVGDVTVWDSKSKDKGSWNDIEVNDMIIPAAGKLSLAKTGNSYDDYDIIIAIRTGDATVSKTISSAGWSTYCSPYALDFSSSIAGLDGAYIITGNSGNTLTLSEAITTTVPANTGLLLKGTASTAVTIPVAATGEYDTEDNILVGVTSSETLLANGGYVLMTDPELGFYKNNNDFTLSANSAYLPTANVSAARSAYFFGGITGVEAVEAATEAEEKDGKFVINGQLVIKKNGKKYNAAGQIVK